MKIEHMPPPADALSPRRPWSFEPVEDAVEWETLDRLTLFLLIGSEHQIVAWLQPLMVLRPDVMKMLVARNAECSEDIVRDIDNQMARERQPPTSRVSRAVEKWLDLMKIALPARYRSRIDIGALRQKVIAHGMPGGRRPKLVDKDA